MLNQRTSWYQWLALMFKEFMVQNSTKSPYEVVDILECQETGFTKAVVKLSERHTIERNISDIVVDNDFLEGLDKKTIRTLTYMATVEQLKPDYSIIVQQMMSEVNDYILEIKSKHKQSTEKKSPTDISRDKELLAKFNPVEANRIGYMAGVCETVKEYKMLREKN